MIALTHVGESAYRSLLKDGEFPVQEIYDRYGAGWVFRLQGILCAMAVHQCSEDAKSMNLPVRSADELYDLVSRYDYGSIFEDNNLESIKPGKTTLEMMLYSMCQAETGDYRVVV